MTIATIVRLPSRRRKLALILPGHNEELIISDTIRSAQRAGLRRNDIYVVDDDSNDKTRELALSLLPAGNVLTVQRSGKARAVFQAIKHFKIEERYIWVHVADADSIFSHNYFSIYKQNLDANKWAAAVGFVQSIKGNWIATYRSFSYTYGQHIIKRLQSWFDIIAVLPGPVTCFRCDIIKDLEFVSESVTEDFDLTLQIHRKKLGRIKFIPEAVNYTQDPRTIKAFVNQTLRWQRGFFQGVRKYKIGLCPYLIDLGIGYQMIESLYYILQLLVILPLLVIVTNDIGNIFVMLLADYVMVVILAIFSAIVAKRPRILLSLTYFYVLRFLELGVFIWAFFEVIVFQKFKSIQTGWKTEGRRYEVSAESIKGL